MARALKALIDCGALKHNLRRVKEQAPGCLIMAMVKANGYGHGIVTVAKVLMEADAYGVACIEEATQLVNAGIQKPIVLMEGFFEKSELPDIVAMNMQAVVHSDYQIQALESFCQKFLAYPIFQPIKVWIKINTGMHRLGFPPEVLISVIERLCALPSIHIVGVLTHFASADELENPETQVQTKRFMQALKPIDQAMGISLSNSAGILGWMASIQTTFANTSYIPWVRPGLMLYGASPFSGRIGQQEGLKPVMTLVSKLIAIQCVKKGGAVGYGGTYIAEKDCRIGVVAVGYGDGYPRVMPTGTPVLVKGVRVPLVGRVSMDMLTVDLSLVNDSNVGDPVQLWGPELPVEEVAVWVNTTAYELLTSLSARVPCEVFGET